MRTMYCKINMFTMTVVGHIVNLEDKTTFPIKLNMKDIDEKNISKIIDQYQLDEIHLQGSKVFNDVIADKIKNANIGKYSKKDVKIYVD